MKKENILNALYNNETIKIEELEKFREDIKLSGYEYYAYYEVQEEPFHYLKI